MCSLIQPPPIAALAKESNFGITCVCPSWNSSGNPQPCFFPCSRAKNAAAQSSWCYTQTVYAAVRRPRLPSRGLSPSLNSLEQIPIFLYSLCMSILQFIQSKHNLYKFWRRSSDEIKDKIFWVIKFSSRFIVVLLFTSPYKWYFPKIFQNAMDFWSLAGRSQSPGT